MENQLQNLREKLSSYLKWAEAEIATTEATSSIQDMIDDVDHLIELLAYYEKNIEESDDKLERTRHAGIYLYHKKLDRSRPPYVLVKRLE